MALRNKKAIIVTAVVGVLALVGIGGYLISKEFSHLEQNQNVKLENRLIIGTYKESKTTQGESSFNRLYIEIIDNGEVKYKESFATDDKSLSTDENYPNCVFVDLTEEMNQYINNLGIYYWGLSNPNKNYIKVRTEFLLGGFLSEEVIIKDSGLYLVNLPTKNGEVPQVEHAYIYQNNKVGWK